MSEFVALSKRVGEVNIGGVLIVKPEGFKQKLKCPFVFFYLNFQFLNFVCTISPDDTVTIYIRTDYLIV